jgi:hypothetical protein
MRNQDLKNTEKVAPSALIGYLVGYKSFQYLADVDPEEEES